MTGYRLFVNEERTVCVWIWESGLVEVAFRNHPAEMWGPPVRLQEET